jgi:hypothetical protein
LSNEAQPRDQNATVEPEHSTNETLGGRELVGASGKGPARVLEEAGTVADG